MDEIYKKLTEAKVGKVLRNEPLSKHTTIKIGGPADILIDPKDVIALEAAMAIINEAQVPWRVIGRGSNLLVDDEGIRGVVIKLDKGIKHIEMVDNILTVGAGFPLVPLATIISKKGYSGFEFAGGIPGSVGGAVYMNAGAHGADISNIIKEARILFEDGTLKWLNHEELGYSYRTSSLQKSKGVCVEAKFELAKGEPSEILENMQSYKTYRHETQPYDRPCAGSIFRNPLPLFSGKLIESAELKGFQIGGAQVSELHANFIINTGTAKAEDVLQLINHIQETILLKNDVKLMTEIEIINKKIN